MAKTTKNRKFMIGELRSPSRDFSPNLKQDLSGLSGFFRQLRSKSCFKMSGLSGFWTVYLKKPLKNRARFKRFWAVYLKKPLKNRARFNNKNSTTEGFVPAIFWFEVRCLIHYSTRTCCQLNIRCICSTEYVQCFRHAEQIYCQDFYCQSLQNNKNNRL